MSTLKNTVRGLGVAGLLGTVAGTSITTYNADSENQSLRGKLINASETQNQLNVLEKQFKELTEQHENLQNKNKSTEEALMQEKNRSQKQSENFVSDIQTAEGKIDEQKQEINNLQNQVNELKTQNSTLLFDKTNLEKDLSETQNENEHLRASNLSLAEQRNTALEKSEQISQDNTTLKRKVETLQSSIKPTGVLITGFMSKIDELSTEIETLTENWNKAVQEKQQASQTITVLNLEIEKITRERDILRNIDKQAHNLIASVMSEADEVKVYNESLLELVTHLEEEVENWKSQLNALIPAKRK